MGSYKDKQSRSRGPTVRSAEAVKQGAAGLGSHETADQGGCTEHATAQQLGARTSERMTLEGAKQLRVMQLDRLQALLEVEWGAATNRDAQDHDKAYDRTLKVLGQIADLFGLDALGYDEEETTDGWPNNTIVLGLTKEEYWEALGKAHAKRRAEEDARLALESTQPLMVDDDEEADL